MNTQCSSQNHPNIETMFHFLIKIHTLRTFKLFFLEHRLRHKIVWGGKQVFLSSCTLTVHEMSLYLEMLIFRDGFFLGGRANLFGGRISEFYDNYFVSTTKPRFSVLFSLNTKVRLGCRKRKITNYPV